MAHSALTADDRAEGAEVSPHRRDVDGMDVTADVERTGGRRARPHLLPSRRGSPFVA
jgi:hypothetical protein